MSPVSGSRRRLSRRAGAVACALACGILMNACASSPPAAPPIGECPQEIFDIIAAEGSETPVDFSEVSPLIDAGVELEASCAFRGEGIGGDVFYDVFYVTEGTLAVVDILGADLTAHGYESQSTVAGEGTWISPEHSIGALTGSADNDATYYPAFDGPYLVLFVN